MQLNLVAAMEALDEPEGLFKDNKTNNSANGRSKFQLFRFSFDDCDLGFAFWDL